MARRRKPNRSGPSGCSGTVSGASGIRRKGVATGYQCLVQKQVSTDRKLKLSRTKCAALQEENNELRKFLMERDVNREAAEEENRRLHCFYISSSLSS